MVMTKHIILWLSMFWLLGCSSQVKQHTVVPMNANVQLEQLIEQYQSTIAQFNPFYRYEPGQANAQLPDLSPEQLMKKNQRLASLYQELLQITTNDLTLENQINLAVLTYVIKDELDRYRFHEHYMPLMAESGFHVEISTIAQQMQLKTEQDFNDYLSRLQQFPRYFQQQIYWMRQGIKSGITQPAIILTGFEKSIETYYQTPISDSVFYQPLVHLPSTISEHQQQLLQQRAQHIIQTAVYPSYQQFYQFFMNEYLPNARQSIAALDRPNGKEFYQNRVAYYTTLPISIDEVHQLGLNEVARIQQQMNHIMKTVGFEGSFADFIHYLRTDPKFYAKSATELLKTAAYIAKQMDGKLPSLFKTLPRTPYTVKPVPAVIAPKYTTGRYSSPSRDDQAGEYWVNTYALDRRPLYVLEALTFHEAVPGHHLQGAIAREMANVPAFRRETYISAFGEGWGLYAEYLGIEAGFYQDPYSEFGRLTYEMWRACRLVVDTGIHAKGWSRSQAIDYLASHTALSLHNVTTEVDRYIAWPGQALSYKIGELTIKRLRQQTEQALLNEFDVREFHDQLLKHGSMPLAMLEQLINRYTAEKLEQTKMNREKERNAK
jgi:uncharacterized protein (DUF885 family)